MSVYSPTEVYKEQNGAPGKPQDHITEGIEEEGSETALIKERIPIEQQETSKIGSNLRGRRRSQKKKSRNSQNKKSDLEPTDQVDGSILHGSKENKEENGGNRDIKKEVKEHSITGANEAQAGISNSKQLYKKEVNAKNEPECFHWKS
ncbi:hypothetical protein PCANC_07812 [Puccinia coronata f. sp. avenae]|uniref:Uncharacterized protein n=1 Tax=Puccinia coronata f. sp. avenae TaxID=200324 RepID=A0A2N5SW23_9BASI|nr:hypothetical protein PCASD_16368 [Puccinia coronata f. sp. avenae]PLW47539.1 hypothetical protein PCANC_07812 [Puccinia coronata f. sp. avenae]